MMGEKPSMEARHGALRIRLKARVVSLAFFAAAILAVHGAADMTGSSPVLVGSAALGLGVIMAFSPVGSMMTFFTAWTGRWINSCPHCASMSIERVETRYLMCDGCAAETFEVIPFHAASDWYTRERGDERDEHYCSWECGG